MIVGDGDDTRHADDPIEDIVVLNSGHKGIVDAGGATGHVPCASQLLNWGVTVRTSGD